MANTYAIYEGNMERLQSKMTRIQNKCRKYGCDFTFREVGEEFRTLKDANGNKYTARFVLVEAEGVAIINDWQFVASLDCTPKGNIINKAVDDIEIPERYYNSNPVCEHCGNTRVQNTFIVRNIKTGEFKQVGNSCLRDFTFGMDAELTASMMSGFRELEKGCEPFSGIRITRYVKVDSYLRYLAETIRHWGYVKSEDGANRTWEKALKFYNADNGNIHVAEVLEKYRDEMEEVGFDANSEKAISDAQSALAWLNEQPEDSNYIHNLKVACSLEYACKGFGIMASLFPAWNKDLERQAKIEQEAKQLASSKHIGNIGDKISFEIAECKCVTGWETQWGYCYIYKFVDKDGNVYTWKTTKDIDCDKVKSMKGTVKAHTEFRGVNQTEMTRCRVA